MRTVMTTKTLGEIRRLNAGGKNDSEIADALGLNRNTAWQWRRRMGLPKNKSRRGLKQYAVYRAETDEPAALGTAKECAAALGMSLTAFYSNMSRAKRGKYRKYEFCEVEKEDGYEREADPV